MAHTKDEIPLPGGVTIEHDELAKAIKAGKSPEECVAVATAAYAPPEVKPEAAVEAPASAAPASEKE